MSPERTYFVFRRSGGEKSHRTRNMEGVKDFTCGETDGSLSHFLRAEAVLADDLQKRAAPDPGVGGGGGVKIVDGAAAWISSAQSLLGSPDRRVGHRLVDLAVGEAGKGARLIDYPRDGVGEGGCSTRSK
jgi:hypothetical protein